MRKLFVFISVTAAAMMAVPATSASAKVTANSAAISTSTSVVRSTSTSVNKNADKLANIKSKSDKAIKDRVTALENYKNEINASKYIAAEHKSGLLTELASQESGLNALDSKIQSDIDTTTATTDAKTIVTNYRVYALVGPKVHEILAIDTITAVDARFQAASPALSRELDVMKAKGTDVSAAQTALADLNAKAAAIAKTNAPLASPVLALQPSGYPTNQATIKSTRTALATEATEAKGAVADIQAIATALGITTTTTTTK